MELVIAICDDLSEERTNLARMIQTYSEERDQPVQLRFFSSGEELLEAFRQSQQFHIVFLDIYMPNCSGMEVARQIRAAHDDTAIVFATTSQDHGRDSFDVQASDYLLKPFRQEDVSQALDWCLEHIPESTRCLTVYSEWEQRELPLSTIQYIDVYGHRSRIHTTQAVLVVRRGLDDLEISIQSPDFLRCHRSFLLNMNYVDSLEGNSFRMSDGTLIPISPSQSTQIRNQFIDWTYIKAWRQK